MMTLLGAWERLWGMWAWFTRPRAVDEVEARREYITRATLAIVAATLAVFTVAFAAFWVLGEFSPFVMVAIAVIDALAALAAVTAYRGHWRASSRILPLVFLLLASYLTGRAGFWSPAPVFFLPAILLAALLHDERGLWLSSAASLLLYAAAGSLSPAPSAEAVGVGTWLAVSAPILGSALLYRLASRRLHALQSERLSAEELARANQELHRLHAAIEQSADGIAITDAQANVHYVNPSFESIFGYRANEILGHNIFALPAFNHDDVESIWEAMRAGQPWRGRAAARLRDGREIYGEISASPVYGESERVTDYVFIGRDVTAEVALEGQRRETQRLEAVGQLAGGAAHYYNNLLQAIIGYTELALEDLPRGHATRPNLLEVRRAAQRAAELTRQLLAFGRKELMRPAQFDLNDLAARLAPALRKQLGQGVAFETSFEAGSLPICGDAELLGRALTHLVANARESLPASGGRVALRTGRAALDASFAAAHAWAEVGQYATLMVADDGVGMTPDVLARAFEPFFTTRTAGQGAGLGLPMVYGIVKQHDGLIDCQSAPGEGTTFTLYLPLRP